MLLNFRTVKRHHELFLSNLLTLLYDADMARTADLQDNVSSIVRGLLGLRHMRQSDLAPVLGVTPSGVNEKLQGRRKWTLNDLDALAAFFDISPATFFDEPEALFKTGRFSPLVGLPSHPEPELPFPLAARQLAAVGS